MSNVIPIIIVLLLFVGVMIVFSIEKLDYVGFSLLAAFISVLVTVLYIPDLNFNTFLAYIEFDPIIFIISMQVIIMISEKHKIFQWIALKTLRFTKGNHRKFFYLICIISSLSASIIADITVAIIFIPLVIRACKILKINPAPYLFGISFTINIGSLYTPFSSSENILIGAAFSLDLQWFLSKFSLYVFPMLILTLVLLDFTMLRKIKAPTEQQKQILLEIMDPNLVIVNKTQFILNSIYLGAVVIGFLFPINAWVVSSLGAILISILNKEQISDSLAKIDWKIIFFFISLFLMIGCMQIIGIFELIAGWTASIFSENDLISAIILLISIGVLSGFLAQVPTAIVFISLLKNLYGFTAGAVPDLILMAFLLGINLGSNFLPQGAACDLMALNLAKKNGVKEFNYKSLLKNGSLITLFHIFFSIIYLSIFYLILY
ncbi:MAG: SLC13 family permease [Promethearchaeota archaeon]